MSEQIEKPEKRQKLTVELVSDRLHEKMGNLSAVARSLGWSRTQVRRFIESHPKLIEKMKEERETMTDNVVSQFYRTCIDPTADGHVTAMIFYLKTQAGWRETQSIELGNVKDQPLKVTEVIIRKETDDEEAE